MLKPSLFRSAPQHSIVELWRSASNMSGRRVLLLIVSKGGCYNWPSRRPQPTLIDARFRCAFLQHAALHYAVEGESAERTEAVVRCVRRLKPPLTQSALPHAALPFSTLASPLWTCAAAKSRANHHVQTRASNPP